MKKFLLAMALLLFTGRAYAQPRFGQLQGYATTAQGGLGMNAGSSSGVPHFSLGVVTFKTIPTCADTSGQHLNWTGSAFACGTSTGTITSLPSLTTFETGALFDDNAYIDFTTSAAPPSSPGPGVLRMFGGTTYPRISFKTIDGYVGTLTFDALSASRTWDFPNVSGKFITDGNVADIGMPTCADSGGQHLNWTGSAWACGTSGDGSGHVIYDETTPLTQRAHLRFEGAPVTCNDTGGETVCIVNEGVSGGSPGYVGGGYILTDRNLASDTDYWINPAGFLVLRPRNDFPFTVANCVPNASPAYAAPGWVWGSPEWGNVNPITSNWMAACDTNVTTANALTIRHSTAQYDNFLGTGGSPTFYKYAFGYAAEEDFIAVMRIAGDWPCSNGTSLGFGLIDYEADNGGKAGFMFRGYGSNCTAFGDLYGQNFGYISPNQTQYQNGIWAMLRCARNAGSCSAIYGLTNTNDPTAVSWNWWDLRDMSSPGLGPNSQRVRAKTPAFFIARPGEGAGTAYDVTIKYYGDWSMAQDSINAGAPMTPWFGSPGGGTSQMGQALPFVDTQASGVNKANPTKTLVASFDLGSASATISNTAMQAALTRAVNQRGMDQYSSSIYVPAAITFSANRDSSEAPSCTQTYASASTATVGGTGRYFSLCTAFSDTNGTGAGSVNIRDLAIPFKP